MSINENTKLRRLLSEYIDVKIPDPSPQPYIAHVLPDFPNKKRIQLFASLIGDVSHTRRVYPSAREARETLQFNREVFEKITSQLQLMEERKFRKVLAITNENTKSLRRIKEFQRRKISLDKRIGWCFNSKN